MLCINNIFYKGSLYASLSISHNCGEILLKNVDEVVKLSGWVDRKRDHGGLLFIDLRDQHGLIQLVIDSDNRFFKICEETRLESVITVSG